MLVYTCIRTGYFSTIVCQSHRHKNLKFCFIQNDIECISAHYFINAKKLQINCRKPVKLMDTSQHFHFRGTLVM